jgi:hypothetical protein
VSIRFSKLWIAQKPELEHFLWVITSKKTINPRFSLQWCAQVASSTLPSSPCRLRYFLISHWVRHNRSHCQGQEKGTGHTDFPLYSHRLSGIHVCETMEISYRIPAFHHVITSFWRLSSGWSSSSKPNRINKLALCLYTNRAWKS